VTNEDPFADLVNSLKQAGQIARGERTASRVYVPIKPAPIAMVTFVKTRDGM
jgi:hypothetical protein